MSDLNVIFQKMLLNFLIKNDGFIFCSQNKKSTSQKILQKTVDN